MPLHEMHYFTTSRNKSTLMNKKIESIHVQLINFHHLNLPTLSFFFHERFQFFSKCEITIYLSILIIGPLWNDICKFFRYRREYDSFLSFAFQILLWILKFPIFLSRLSPSLLLFRRQFVLTQFFYANCRWPK